MPVTVRIPTQLRELSGGASEVAARRGDASRRCSSSSTPRIPASRERLFDDKGELRRFVNVFVADEDIRFLQGSTPR